MNKRNIIMIAVILCAAIFIKIKGAQASTVAIDLEAESGSIESPMERRTQDGITYISTSKADSGKATYTFTVPASGEYEIKGKTTASKTSQDSFRVSIDGKTEDIWDVPNSTDWQWNTIKLRNNSSGTWKLSAGSHKLTILGREAYTMIDRLQVIALTVDQGTTTDPTVVTPILGNAYYINPVTGNDTNNGGESKPWKSIQYALSKAKPGTVIKLMSGTYSEEIETMVDGTKDKPIVIEPATGATVVFDFAWIGNAPRLVNSNYIFRNIEVRRFNQGIRIEEAENVVVEGVNLHHGKHECLRIRHFARNNVIRNNTVHFCGASSDEARIEGGNGEGIYIGTAPEQRDRNDGKPDTSTGNIIKGNKVYDVTEGIDVKEDSSKTQVIENRIWNASDVDSGGINVRADDITVSGNLSENNKGSGYRFGGDSGILSPVYGDNHHYGINNILRGNTASNNAVYGYKFMWGPQDADCSNKVSGNNKGTFYFASGVSNFLPSACKSI